jgi:hypothetical protein
MTLWAGQFGTDLVHDFHPGIPPSGLFWTEPILPDAVAFDLDRGTASFRLADFAMPDFIGEASGLRELWVPALVSMEIVWKGNGTVLSINDPSNEFDGSYQECEATIDWSAVEEGFRYRSAATIVAETRFAQIGRERTGIYAGAQ